MTLLLQATPPLHVFSSWSASLLSIKMAVFLYQHLRHFLSPSFRSPHPPALFSCGSLWEEEDWFGDVPHWLGNAKFSALSGVGCSCWEHTSEINNTPSGCLMLTIPSTHSCGPSSLSLNTGGSRADGTLDVAKMIVFIYSLIYLFLVYFCWWAVWFKAEILWST